MQHKTVISLFPGVCWQIGTDTDGFFFGGGVGGHETKNSSENTKTINSLILLKECEEKSKETKV